MGFMRSDKFDEAFFVLDCLFDASEIFLVFEIALLYFVEGLLLWVESLESLGGEEVGKRFCLFEQFQAHLEVGHFKFNEVVYQHLVEGIGEIK